MIVFDKFCFIGTPRTGSHSIRRAIIEHYPDAVNVGSVHFWRPVDKRIATIAVIRNPFTRLLSLFRFCEGDSFVEFVTRRLWSERHGTINKRKWCSEQAEFLNGVRVDYLCRFERLANDVAALPCNLGALPHINATGVGLSCKTQYTVEMADAVRRFCKNDFKAFGYSTEVP